MSLTLGIDLGTSGIRSAILAPDGMVLAMARGTYPATDPNKIDATVWWHGVRACIRDQVEALRNQGHDPSEILAIAVDGTSGSMVLVDASLAPVTQALMYNSSGFKAEAAAIAKYASDPHITRGQGSALARAMRLLQEDRDGNAAYLLHQADFIAAKLMGRGGFSDFNNTLKTGFDPETESWPDWLDDLGIPRTVMPHVVVPGSAMAPIAPDVAASLGLSAAAMVHAGTTDSIAAFLACAPLEPGIAVTSLGTTLAIKLLSETKIDAPELGLYSHRLGPYWLVGGASNSGGGVLRAHFDDAHLAQLSAQIDPDAESKLDYYPLLKPGERFPVNDPTLEPRLTPRPQDDAAFLHGMLEGIARIEKQAYEAMTSLGAPYPRAIYTAGGGAKNHVWTAIRARLLGCEMREAEASEASIGTARLVLSQTSEL